MPKTIRIAKTAIDDAISSFGELPAKAPADYSLREAIQQVLPAINDLIKRGYDLDEISTLLTQKNIPISSSTLKQYLRDFNQTKAKSSKAKVSSTISKSQVAVSSNSTGSKSSKPVPTAVSTENPIPNQDSTVEQSASTKKTYKSPPKPGAEQFK